MTNDLYVVTILNDIGYINAMFRQLLALLFLFSLAIPAVAAPLHDMPAVDQAMSAHRHDTGTMQHDQHGGQDLGDKATSHHCIGCVAPFVLPEMTVYTPLPPVPALARAIDELAGLALLPATPPPRPA